MDSQVSFGFWLEKRRKALDLTREELAQKVGCSISTLRKIESDERRPSKQLAELMADMLDIRTDERATFLRIARGELAVERMKSSPPLPDLSLLQSFEEFLKQIPVPPTPLIGREPELIALREMIHEPQCRLITLFGPGGIGKTRLAIETAIQQNREYSQAVAFVSLASLSSVSLIVHSIADALGFSLRDSGEPKTQLIDYLREKKLLLVLDNFEHLLDGVDLLMEVIRFAPKAKILCTSREQLNVQGEWVFEVRGLSVPDAEALFVNCAHRVLPDFLANEANRQTIIQICRLVEGMPLAIELAATWLRILSLTEIEHEMQHNLDFLSTTMRDLPERHRSMRVVFEHSWRLLTIEEQQALSRLSVFRGGFTREAAEQVAKASLAILLSLVSKSLVQRTEAGRYYIHELLRQYTATLLQSAGEEQITAQEHHYDFYLAQAEAAKQDLRGPHQSEYLEWLEREHDNIRAALDWSLERHDDRALQLACALRWFWYVHGHFHEGHDWLMKALQSVPERHSGDLRLRARALEGAALLVNALGDHSTARQIAEESVVLFREQGDQRGLADALLLIGHARLWQGEVAEGHTQLVEALTLYREAGDRLGEARTLSRIGSSLADWGGNRTGRAMLEGSVAILQELGDKYFIGSALVSLGIVSLGSGEFASARAYFEQALAIARETGHVWTVADALTNLGCVARIVGDYNIGGTCIEEALQIYKEQGFSIWRADPLCALAEIDIAQGDFSTARSRLQEASALVEKSENKWLQTLVSYFLGLLAYYEGNIERATMSLEKTTMIARDSQYLPDLARSLTTLGRVMYAQGNLSRALTLLHESLDLYHRLDQKLGIAISLEGLAGLAAEKDATYSAKLFGIAEAIREAIGAPLPPVDRPYYENDVARACAQLGKAILVCAWAEGKAMSLEGAIDLALDKKSLSVLVD